MRLPLLISFWICLIIIDDATAFLSRVSPGLACRSGAIHKTNTPLIQTFLSVGPPSPETVEIGVKFTDVLLPTYLGCGFVFLSYKIDSDPEFVDKEITFLRANPKTALTRIASFAGLGLVTLPFVTGAHYLACFLLGAISEPSSDATQAPLPFQTVAKTSIAALTSATLFPLSFGLACIYLSFQMDRNPNYARNLWENLQAYAQNASVKFIDEEQRSTLSSPSVQPEEFVAPVIVDALLEPPVVVVAKEQLQRAEASLSKSIVVEVRERERVTATTTAAATNIMTPMLKLLRFLYFPWLEMFLGKSQGKRRRFAKFLQLLYLPWLDMVLPSKFKKEKV
jgi:hypothetical protein